MKTPEVRKISEFLGHKDAIYKLSNFKSDSEFISTGAEGLVIAWNINNPDQGTVVSRATKSCYTLLNIDEMLIVFENQQGIHFIRNNKVIKSIEIINLAFYSSEVIDNHIYIGSDNGQLIVIDLEKFEVSKHIKLCNGALRCVKKLNENTLLIGSASSELLVWDIAKQVTTQTLKAHESTVFDIAVINENQLLTVGKDAKIKSWQKVGDLFENISEIPAHLFVIHTISLHPSGNYFVTGSMDKAIKLWRTADLKLLKVIDAARHKGHTSSVNTLIWLDSGTKLISGSDDRRIISWEFPDIQNFI